MDRKQRTNNQVDIPLRKRRGKGSCGRGSGGLTGKGFQPGKSGNPSGRKPGPNYIQRFKKLVEECALRPIPPVIAKTVRGRILRAMADNPRLTNEEGVNAAVWYAALRGESWAVQQLYGAAKQSMDLKADVETTATVDIANLTSEQMDKITDAIVSLRKK